MAFVDLDISKADVARRNAAGQGSIALPVTGLTEVSIRVPGCSGCSKEATHDACTALAFAVPHGETRYQRVSADERLTVDDVRRLQSALHLLGYVTWGYVPDAIRYNAGAANNGSQFVDYEVVSAVGTTLRLKGANPKRISVGSSRVNPEWPLPDPVTGSTARIISGTEVQCLPVGASVEFAWPSILWDKIAPLIVDIDVPASEAETVEFDVTVNASVSAADTPWDAFYPPADGKYYCRVRWEAVAPYAWKNVQAPPETAFAPQEMTFFTAAEHELLDSDSGSTRILWPGMREDAVTVLLTKDGETTLLAPSVVEGLLAITPDGSGGWETVIDLSEQDFDEATVSYWAEAVATDTDRRQFAGGCIHAQADPSGAYNGADGTRCMRPEASGFATFEGASCWKPGSCDGFGLGDAAESYGNAEFPPGDVGDADWWTAMWTAASWIIVQGIPGSASSRNFQLFKPAGSVVSIQGLAGGWRNDVPEGVFASRTPLFAPKWGQRITWTDGDGDDHQQVRLGAFYAEGLDLTDLGGPDLRWDASGAPAAGSIASAVSGWGAKEDARGASLDAALARLPWRGVGRCHVYQWSTGGAAQGVVNETVPVEAIVAACDLGSAEDSSVTAAIRARWG